MYKVTFLWNFQRDIENDPTKLPFLKTVTVIVEDSEENKFDDSTNTPSPTVEPTPTDTPTNGDDALENDQTVQTPVPDTSQDPNNTQDQEENEDQETQVMGTTTIEFTVNKVIANIIVERMARMSYTNNY